MSHDTAALVGGQPGQTDLVGSAAGAPDTKRPLESGRTVLPELEEASDKRRPWWRHPALVVSVILTVLSLAAAATLYVLQLSSPKATPVTNLSISASEATVHLSWSGGSERYSLYSVDGQGKAVDQSVWIRGAGEAWIPAASGAYESTSCFVVRPSSVTGGVSLGSQELSDQGGQRICLDG